MVRIVRQEGLSVKVILFRDFRVLKVLVPPGNERFFEGRVSVKRGVVGIDTVLSSNDFVDLPFSNFGGSNWMVVREGEGFPYGNENASLVVCID